MTRCERRASGKVARRVCDSMVTQQHVKKRGRQQGRAMLLPSGLRKSICGWLCLGIPFSGSARETAGERS